jgi:hypothetical protein
MIKTGIEIIMRIMLALAAVALTATPLLAETTQATVKRGAVLRDAKKLPVGTVDRVNADGSIQIIFGPRVVVIPAEKIVIAQNDVSTTLTKMEVARLR